MLPPVVNEVFVLRHRDELSLIDARSYLDGRSGRAAYRTGHLAGAVFVDLDSELAGPPSPESGRHPLPSPEAFAKAMGRHGISRESHTVAYDDRGGVAAARLVFMLRALGCSSALLDGGIAAWPEELEIDEVVPPLVHFEPAPWPSCRLADIDEVASGRALLLDARDGSRFRGEGDPFDPRTGHIPGARSAPCSENLDADGRFASADQLRARYLALGVTDESKVICYCGSGVTACHNLLALELAGFGKQRLYPGSWSQWASDPTRPIETGQ